MKSLFRWVLALCAASLSNSLWAASDMAPNCEKWLNAHATSVFEQGAGGPLIERTQNFPVTDWSPMGGYDGIALIKPLASPLLEVTYRSKSGKVIKKATFKKMVPYLDKLPNYQKFEDFVAGDFFVFSKSGQYTLRLLSKDKTVCTQTYTYEVGD